MASYTKLYTQSTFLSPSNPPWFVPTTFQGSWDDDPSGSASGGGLVGYIAGTNSDFVEVQEFDPTPDITLGIYRWTSGPLLAGTTGGNVDMVMGCRESDAAANFSTKVYIYITQGATNTVRGVVLDFVDTDEWPTTGQGIGFSAPQAAGTVNYLDGDRLVIEMGLIARNSVSTNYQGRIWAGGFWDDPELGLGDTNVTAGRGFFSFTTPILIDDPAPDEGDLIALNEQIFIYDGTTGDVKRIILSSSSSGLNDDPANALQLSDGRWAVPLQSASSTSTVGELAFYTADFEIESVISLSPGVRAHSITLDAADNLYIGFRGNSNTNPSDASSAVQKRDSTGTLLASYNVARGGGPGASSIDLAADGETLYYVNRGRIVSRYNVATDTQLADLVTLPTEVGPDYSTAARAFVIRLLPDDEALVADLIDIKRISTVDGTILQRYDYPNVEDWQHVSIGVDAETFVSATIGAPNSSAVTGAATPTVQGATGAATPLAVQWELESGDILLEFLQDVDPDTGGSQRGFTTPGGWTPVPSGGSIIVEKVTVPESDETDFDFTAGGGLSPTTFTLSHGETETFADVDVGEGYFVTETPNILYQTTYNVSNGSPHTNITVANDETVTVTVTNSSTHAPGFNTRAVKRRWLRRSPIFSKENARVRYTMFQLDAQVGTGTNAEPGMDPQVYMRYSDNSGKTWSFVMPMPMGKKGKAGTQMQWWRLGVGRNRVFEVYGSDPVQVALLDGFARVDPGTDGDA